jgi:quinol monooxygenase YgiN
MFLTIVRIFPNPDEKETIRGFLGALLRPVCAQLGCLGCSLAIESDPEALVLIETWESEKDLVHRLQSDGYAKVLATMELSIKKPQVIIYEVVSQHGMESIEKVRTVRGIDAPNVFHL